MLRCAASRVVRVISSRGSSAGSALVGESAGIAGGIIQRRFLSSISGDWLKSRYVLSATHGADESGNFGIATGMELEELVAQKQGLKRFDLDPPRGPFGTKDDPAIVESVFDERIVGCSGGVGEDEHDVVWFKLHKDKSYECPVCTQVLQLKVVGEGGLPGAHH
ncbi:hypothetical protein R1flu_009338 [Riccia fluitans]|uniref:Cytochrome c oxidase subunit Vb n=1 Tax=Riccia fluitans TaxID=41844 RepID=A0ABD1Z1U6_9MARC